VLSGLGCLLGVVGFHSFTWCRQVLAVSCLSSVLFVVGFGVASHGEVGGLTCGCRSILDAVSVSDLSGGLSICAVSVSPLLMFIVNGLVFCTIFRCCVGFYFVFSQGFRLVWVG
jgi:hypothetical protein